MKCEDCKYKFKSLDGLCKPAIGAFQKVIVLDEKGNEVTKIITGDCVVKNAYWHPDQDYNDFTEYFVFKWINDCRGNPKLILSPEIHGAIFMASDRLLIYCGMEEEYVRRTLSTGK